MAIASKPGAAIRIGRSGARSLKIMIHLASEVEVGAADQRGSRTLKPKVSHGLRAPSF